jgi:hypothetical protein
MGATKLAVSDDVLKDLYISQGLRQREIAEMFGCAVSAVSQRLKKAGIQTRRPHDYPTTDRQRSAWVEIGKGRKGMKMSAEAKKKMSTKATGRRKRNDYEFGGHEKKRDDGYIKVYVPNHPNCTADGYVMKHILVMESAIGRHLIKGECVHHINHIRDDNRIENLKLMTISEHMSMHMKERYANRGNKTC